MPERDGYLPGVPCWVETTQPDPEAAAAFYGGLFGWELEDAMPPGSEGRYLVGRLRGGDVAAVSSQPDGVPPRATWNTYVWVQSADEAAARAHAAGGSVVTEPFDVMDAGRMAVLTDPEGAVWVGTPEFSIVRVAEGGQVLQRVELSAENRAPFALMLGGSERRTLFILTVEWRKADGHVNNLARLNNGPRTGQILALPVSVPGAGRP